MDQSIDHLRTWLDNLLAAARYRRVQDVCVKTLRLARSEQDISAESASLVGLAAAYHHTGRYHDARTLAEGALDYAERSGEPQLIADALCIQGKISLELQIEPYAAISRYEEALEIARSGEYVRGMASALTGMAVAHLMLDSHSDAQHAAEAAIEMTKAIGNAPMQYEALTHYGGALLHQHNVDEAVNILKQAYDLAQEAKFPMIEAQAHIYMSDAFAQRDSDPRSALTLLKQALTLSNNHGYVYMHLQTLLQMGRIHMLWGEFTEAGQHFDDIIKLGEACNAPMYDALGSLYRGMLHDAMSAYHTALDDFTRAEAISMVNHSPYYQGQANRWMSLMHSKLNDYNAAINRASIARSIFLSVDDHTYARLMFFEMIWLHIKQFTHRLLNLVGVRKDQ